MQVWVVGKITGEAQGNQVPWKIIGVFSTEEKAVAECKDAMHFVGPETIDIPIHENELEWPGCRFPKMGQ